MITIIVVFLLGLIFGSFLNVCIHRIPRGDSVVFPSSHCPSCGRSLSPFELIPLISYLLQSGRCKGCNEQISVLYPFIELITGIAFAGLYWLFGALSEDWVVSAILVCFLIVITVIDIQHRIIPNKILITALVLTIAWQLWHITILEDPWPVIINSLVGGVTGFGLLYALCLLSRGGMGMGDVKFAFVFGLLLGWPATLWALTIAGLTGSLVGITGMIIGKWNRKTEIPFGPFLALGVFTAFLMSKGFLSTSLKVWM